MQLLKTPITLDELQNISSTRFGNMTKAVVDIRKKLLVVDADLHADQERFLLEQGSQQSDLWGINLYPAEDGPAGLVEFDSMINLRPSQGNFSRSVENPEIQQKIIQVVKNLITTSK
jgi:hypothetical protein